MCHYFEVQGFVVEGLGGLGFRAQDLGLTLQACCKIGRGLWWRSYVAPLMESQMENARLFRDV